jgi:hypothetical protein
MASKQTFLVRIIDSFCEEDFYKMLPIPGKERNMLTTAYKSRQEFMTVFCLFFTFEDILVSGRTNQNSWNGT